MIADGIDRLDRLEIRDAEFVGWEDGSMVAPMLAVRRLCLVRRRMGWGASAVPGARALTPATRAMIDARRR